MVFQFGGWLVLSMLILHGASSVVETGTVELNLVWTDVFCGNKQCSEPNTSPVSTYVRSRDDPTNAVRKMFSDPVPPGQQVIGLNATLTGRFNCDNVTDPKSLPMFLLVLNEATVLFGRLDLAPYGCAQGCVQSTNCMKRSQMFSSAISTGWSGQGYHYGGPNRLSVAMIRNSIYLSSIDLLIFTQGHNRKTE
eukprot:TRINITY_DN15185_c0_g1_i1.p2 TRINITY_DN15185_c0_g1~~TRINITY_DN15185_c0_g1_i1.p2  ORF type:complete len:193 (+),score=20.59 TRINITY_DN15185_c0_g1_i1:46-624(+)